MKLGRSAVAAILVVVTATSLSASAFAQDEVHWTGPQVPILRGIEQLSALPESQRTDAARQLAVKIRQLPDSFNNLLLATLLATRANKGYVGHDALQEIANTLVETLKLHPVGERHGRPAYPYTALAQLVRYEHIQATLDDPEYRVAMGRLEAEDARRNHIDFTLPDIDGRLWSMKSLRGKVVLVNFWATWCPPCRVELPDLERISQRFKDQLVILAITDEPLNRVRPFALSQHLTFPILLDDGGKVTQMFSIDSYPKSFIYDREGKLVSQAVDMRTENQFLDLLAQAGLK